MSGHTTVLVTIRDEFNFQPSSTWTIPPDVIDGKACLECQRTDGVLEDLGTIASVVPCGRPGPWRTVRPQPADVADRVIRVHARCAELLAADEAALADWVAASPLRNRRNGVGADDGGPDG